jgi:hypothetical protein
MRLSRILVSDSIHFLPTVRGLGRFAAAKPIGSLLLNGADSTMPINNAENLPSSRSSRATIWSIVSRRVRTASERVSEQFLGEAQVKSVRRSLATRFISRMLLNDSPVISLPASQSAAALFHDMPSGLKFSSASPSGSIREWHEAHNGLLRCTSRTSFRAGSRP